MLIYIFILLFVQLNAAPSNEELERAYQIRKMPIPDVQHIVDNERQGLLGYHGDSIDYMIYQDIIRYVIEIIVEIPVREDFHFLAVPLDPAQKIQTKEKLLEVFTQHRNPTLILSESTFSLNANIWDNYNRFGINSIENYVKNLSVKPLGYKRRLRWLFTTLGIPENQIDLLFGEAYRNLNSTGGMLLQIFDQSHYEFSKGIAYPSYPNGFISRNVTVDECFDAHEIRLLINDSGVLNPNNPLCFLRYGPDNNKYRMDLERRVRILPFNTKKRNAYKQNLERIWE